ncbi:MAG: hypothetical protein PIR02_16675 [Microbacterium enclense]
MDDPERIVCQDSFFVKGASVRTGPVPLHVVSLPVERVLQVRTVHADAVTVEVDLLLVDANVSCSQLDETVHFVLYRQVLRGGIAIRAGAGVPMEGEARDQELQIANSPPGIEMIFVGGFSAPE